MRAYPPLAIAMLASLTLTVGCTSKDQTAATAAAQADAEFQQGRYIAAARSIRRAIAARDDVSDYWLTLARIDLAIPNYAGAFDAYQNVLQFDRANVEALRHLCQLGLAVRQPDKVDQYADQLLLLTPQDPTPVIAKGGAALQRNDSVNALRYADQILAIDPRNVSALILKGQVLAFKQDYVGAAKLIESSLDPSGDQTSRLTFLRDIYSKVGNFDGYGRSVSKLAQIHPEDPDMQRTFADLLYQTDRPAEALAVLRRIMLRRPNDIGLAASIGELWLDQGADALSPDQILAAKNLPLEMRAAFAQFANETGRPDLALALVDKDAAIGEPDQRNSSAKAAAAFALGLNGHVREGLAQLQQILDVDSGQPRALLARARLRALSGNAAGALSDARQAVTDDPLSITARLVLSDILLQQKEAVLAESTLREAVRARPEAARPAARLAELLTKTGRNDAAASVLQDLDRAAPVSIRARRLLAHYHVASVIPAAA